MFLSESQDSCDKQKKSYETDDTGFSTTTSVEIKTVEPKSQRALRSLAFQLLYAIDRSNYEISVFDLVDLYKEYYGLQIADNCFSLEIVNGVIDNNLSLQTLIKPFLENWNISRLSCATRLLLCMAAWELKYFTKTPQKAVVDEYVELAKAYGENDCYKFINGILDKLLAPEPKES